MMQEIPPGFRIDLPTATSPQPQQKQDHLETHPVLLENFRPNPKWTFASFVEDETNQMALHSIQKIANEDGDRLLLLQAEVGQGKSHLLHACASLWKQRHPEANCRLLSAATFTHNFVQALLDQKKGLHFHQEIRELDALFFDDLHFLTSKRATCLALFQGIEALRNLGKPVVVTCRAPFSELVGLEPWMKSRLQEGLISINPARKSLREKLVQNLCSARHIRLNSDAIEMLVRELPGSPRELNGAVNRIAEYHELNQEQSLSIERIRLLLMDFFSGRSNVPHVEAIKTRVASYFGITTEDMESSSRQRRLTQPRQVAMFFCKKLTPRSLPEIGRLFGNRDHSTVIHAVRVVEKRRESEHFFDEELLSLERQILECPTI